MDFKALPLKSLDVFCAVFDFSKGQADITCPASDYPTACLRACERRGLLVWDTERVKGETKRYCALTPLGAKVGCESMAMALMPSDTMAVRNRQWVKVQFDVHHEDYSAAYQIAGELAREGLLAPTVRDLLLIHHLADHGDYSLFYQLYGIPATKETAQFETMLQSFASMSKTIQDLADENRKLREQLQPSKGIRTIAEQVDIPAPVFEDNSEVLIEVHKDTSNTANKNFLKSMFALIKSKED